MNLKALAAPFPASDIFWRVGRTTEDKTKGQALPYIVPRAVQSRLDEVVGPDMWRNSFTDVVTTNRHVAVRCSLGIYSGTQWVDKEDGAQVDANLGNNAEYAVKGAYSDAFKRAAVMWGIGRYLYAFQAPWVDLDEDGRMTSVPQLPAHLLPEGDTSVGNLSNSGAPARVKAPVTQSEGAETPAEVTPAQPEEPPAPATAQKAVDAPAPAVSKPVAEPAAPPPSPVKAAAPTAAPAPAAVAAPVAPNASAAQAGATVLPYTEDELAALPERERQYVKSITTHLEKRTSLQNLRAYVNGPKMQQSLAEGTRQRLTSLIDAAIGQQELSAQA